MTAEEAREERHNTPDDEPGHAPAEQERAQPRPRFRAATDEELDTQSFMVSDDRSAVRVVIRGGSIADERGNADFIGGTIQRLARALRETAANYVKGVGETMLGPAQLHKVGWTSSVVIELEISPTETVDRALDGSRHSPTIDAARALGNLLAANPNELIPQALEIGGSAVSEYKRFLGLIAEDRVSLEWQAVDVAEIVVVTSADAAQDFAILDRQGETTTETIRVPGTLSMADSRRQRFELSLPPAAPRPPLLRRKRIVEGEYADDVGHKLKTEGLWDAEVMATIQVTYDVPGTTATPREPKYVLTDASPLVPNRLF